MKVKNPLVFFSLIIPVYNCPSIYTDIKQIAKVCKKLKQPFEIICVVDGLKDRADQTLSEVQRFLAPYFSYYFLDKNRGKGFAVRYGFTRANGKILGFIDAGHDIEPEGILIALKTLQTKRADIVIGNKKNSHSQISYPVARRIYSSLLHYLIRIFLNLPFEDTQVGLKLFKKEVLTDLLPRLTINRWAFDLELLALAQKKRGLVVREFPITITYNYATNISFRDVGGFMVEFLIIFYLFRIKRKS